MKTMLLRKLCHLWRFLMVFAVILAGGVGSRMGAALPKQYIEVEGKPVLIHTLEKFQASVMVDRIAIVADKEWRDQIRQWLSQYGITKFLDFADPGVNRQASVLSGLVKCDDYSQDKKMDKVVIHDAARALITPELIDKMLNTLTGDCQGCMAYLPLKDAIFFSEDGECVDQLVDRNKLFSAQTPECFYLHAFREVNARLTPLEMEQATGNYELAFKEGWKVCPVKGDENNFKLTTPGDMDRMISLLRAGKA